MKFNFDTPENAQIIFSDEANKFVQDLHSKFGTKILDLLDERVKNQAEYMQLIGLIKLKCIGKDIISDVS